MLVTVLSVMERCQQEMMMRYLECKGTDVTGTSSRSEDPRASEAPFVILKGACRSRSPSQLLCSSPETSGWCKQFQHVLECLLRYCVKQQSISPNPEPSADSGCSLIPDSMRINSAGLVFSSLSTFFSLLFPSVVLCFLNRPHITARVQGAGCDLSTKPIEV